jgi:ribose 1,5-bisphosphokinase PhnN
VTYAEAMSALHDIYLTLQNILRRRLGQQTREQLELVTKRLEPLVRRDNGRR